MLKNNVLIKDLKPGDFIINESFSEFVIGINRKFNVPSQGDRASITVFRTVTEKQFVIDEYEFELKTTLSNEYVLKL